MSLGMNKKQQKVSAKDEPASGSKNSNVLQVKKHAKHFREVELIFGMLCLVMWSLLFVLGNTMIESMNFSCFSCFRIDNWSPK